jgi:hypothetical protein
MKSNILKYIGSGFMMIALAASVQAVPQSLPLNTATEALTGTDVVPSSGLLASMTTTMNQTFAPGAQGTLYSAVYQGNSYGGSDLTFVYEVTVTGNQFKHLSLNGYGDNNTVLIGTDGGGSLMFTTVARSTAPGTPIDVALGQDVTSGTSEYVIIQTQDTTYGIINEAIQDGGQSVAAGYSPAVPDGGSTALLLGAVLSVFGMIRRKLA